MLRLKRQAWTSARTSLRTSAPVARNRVRTSARKPRNNVRTGAPIVLGGAWRDATPAGSGRWRGRKRVISGVWRDALATQEQAPKHQAPKHQAPQAPRAKRLRGSEMVRKLCLTRGASESLSMGQLGSDPNWPTRHDGTHEPDELCHAICRGTWRTKRDCGRRGEWKTFGPAALFALPRRRARLAARAGKLATF